MGGAQTGVDIVAEMMGKAGDFTAGSVAHGFNLVKIGDNQLNWVIGEERDMRDEMDEKDGHGRKEGIGVRIGGGFHIVCELVADGGGKEGEVHGKAKG